MKIKFEIKHWYTGAVLFEYEKENNTFRDTILEAIKRSADLRYANLSSANLSYANLSSANLSYANLRYANLRYANLSSAKNLNSDATDFWWHVHHEILVETLTEPVRARINYIKSDKPKNEVELRLQLMKPVLGKIPSTDKGWEKLHKQECKKCPWNGKTIFSK